MYHYLVRHEDHHFRPRFMEGVQIRKSVSGVPGCSRGSTFCPDEQKSLRPACAPPLGEGRRGGPLHQYRVRNMGLGKRWIANPFLKTLRGYESSTEYPQDPSNHPILHTRYTYRIHLPVIQCGYSYHYAWI